MKNTNPFAPSHRDKAKLMKKVRKLVIEDLMRARKERGDHGYNA